MKKNILFFVIISFSLLIISSCKKDNLEKLFKQPTVEITGYTLKGLPGDTAYLDVDMKVINNDDREANIKDVEYNVTIEGVDAIPQTSDIGEKILVDEPLELTLPLSLLTKDAIKLLSKMDAGESLNYTATGTFHVDDPIIKKLDLPIDVSGSAEVEGGFADFYTQPEITVDDITGAYTSDGSTYTFDFDVSCTAKNMDARQVSIDEIEYIVYIEDIASETQLYSNSYTGDLLMDANGTISLNLPVSLELNDETGSTLADAVNAGTISFVVEGTFHAKEVDGTAVDFALPLYLEGSLEADFLSDLFQQPSVEITGYTLNELPGDSAYLEIAMLVTNNDTREATISDMEYTVEVEGIAAKPEEVTVNKTILVGTPLELTLPLAFLTSDAIQLLDKLDAGETLSYTATGTFHVDEPVLNLFELPLDISGTAQVEVGYEDFYEQPEVTVNDMDGTYSTSGFPIPTSYTANFDANCAVQNKDNREVTIDEVEYTVTVEGVKSTLHYYSDTYSTNLVIAGNATELLTLPVTMNLNATQGAALVSALADGTAEYVIEGTFHAIEVDGTASDFTLPLYVTGSVPATMVSSK